MGILHGSCGRRPPGGPQAPTRWYRTDFTNGSIDGINPWPSARADGTDIAGLAIVLAAAVADGEAEASHRPVAEDGVKYARVGRPKPRFPEPIRTVGVVGPADAGVLIVGHDR